MEKKPEWLKVRYNQDAVNEVAALMRDLKLNTVCKEANCPNLGECYQKHTSTFLQRHHRTPPAARPGGAHERGEGRQKAESAPCGADLLHP